MGNLKFAAIAAAMACSPTMAFADTVVQNSAPAAGWLFGSGNNYSPSNTAVLTTDAESQVFLRWHIAGSQAPASVDGTYDFAAAAATGNLGIDFGFTAQSGVNTGNVSAVLTLTQLSTGTVVTLPLSYLPDNYSSGGTVENSERLKFGFLFGNAFNPLANDTFSASLAVTGLNLDNPEGTFSLSSTAQIGTGAAAVPEPASWAMMIGGFGMIGASLRRRKAVVSFS